MKIQTNCSSDHGFRQHCCCYWRIDQRKLESCGAAAAALHGFRSRLHWVWSSKMDWALIRRDLHWQIVDQQIFFSLLLIIISIITIMLMFQTSADCHIDHLATTTASATTTTTATVAETAGSVLNHRATMILLVASADLDCNIICIRWLQYTSIIDDYYMI